MQLKQGEVLPLLNWQKKFFLIKMPQIAKDVGKLALSHVAGGNVNWYKPFGRNLATCIKNHKRVCSCDPVIPLLEIYSKEITQNVGGSISHKKMFIIAEAGNNQNVQ